MSIILVGNSKNVLLQKRGQEIDKFDTVVRFNNFQLEGFEEYVGNKVDIIARRACDDVFLHPTRSDKPKILAFVTYSRYSHGMLMVARNLQGYYGSACEVISVVECKKTGEKIGLDQPVPEACSIGVLAIDYFLKRHDKITLHGFGGNPEEHYFKKPPRDAGFHAWEKERNWINQLKKEGRIEDLK